MGATAVGFFGSLGDQAQEALKRHRDAIDKKNEDWRTHLWGIYDSKEASPESRQQALDELTKYYPKEKPIKEVFDKLKQAGGMFHKHLGGQGGGQDGQQPQGQPGQAPAQMTPPPSAATAGAGDVAPATGMGRMGGGGGAGATMTPPPQAAAATAAAAPAQMTKPPGWMASAMPTTAQEDERKLRLYQRTRDIDRAAKIAEEQAKPVAAGRTAAAAKPTVLYTKNGEPWGIERPGADGKLQIVTPDDPDFTAADQRTLDADVKATKAGEEAKAAGRPYNVATELHKEHPDWTPEKIQSVIAAGKSTGLGTYAMVRLLDFAAKYDPSLLDALPQILRKAGIALPPGFKVGIPAGMPTDEAGNPIGTSMPGAPTGQTRARGQLAEGMLNEIPRIKKEIAESGDLLGPALGRWNEFMTGRIGGDENDPNYGRYQAIRTDMLLLSSGAAKMHLNSVRAVDEFNRLASTGKMTPDVLNNFIGTVEKWATTYAAQGRGKSLAKAPAKPTPPPGNGSGGVVRWKRDASGNPVPVSP